MALRAPAQAARTSAGPRQGDQRGAEMALRVASFILLLLFVVVWLVPFAWAVDTSLKPEGETTIVPITWLSSHFNLDSYGQVLDQGNLPRWYLNSFVISSVVTVATIILASLASFAFSQIRFRGRQVMFWVVMAGIMIPGQMLIVPLYTMMNDWNLVDTYWAVILPQIPNSIAVFVFKQFFDGIPKELSDAAVLDGCSKLRIYWRVWMPLAKSATAAVAIFSFVWSWNNFLWPLIAIVSTEMMPLTVGLGTILSAYGIQYAEIMASAVLAAIPILIVFAVFQKQIVQGIAGSGIKG
jgi:multiple sugar transport system permease protein